MNPYERVWSERSLPKTNSDLSESDVESDKPNSKQQSSLFIHKLYEMATCDAHAHVFGFSEDGMSLKIRNPSGLGPVLLRYFKHSNTSSFIRQLNNYGFKTISSVSNGNSVQTFAHPYFYREGKELLDSITRKTAKNVKRCKGDIIKELQHVETEYRKRFRDMEGRNQALERKNEALENENKRLRHMCQELEKMHLHPLPLEPISLQRNSAAALAPLFDSVPLGTVDPLLEVCSTSSETSRSPLGDELYNNNNNKDRMVSEDTFLDALIQNDTNWICTGNEFMV